MLRRLLAEIAYWLHAVIMVVWFGLFFIPRSVWSGVIAFHFWYILIMVLSELAWGVAIIPVIHRYRPTCLLTSFMQWLRGIPLRDPRNHDHSFVREFVQRTGISIPNGVVAFLIYLSLAIAAVQMFLF